MNYEKVNDIWLFDLTIYDLWEDLKELLLNFMDYFPWSACKNCKEYQYRVHLLHIIYSSDEIFKAY
jgi:hypothetical protein